MYKIELTLAAHEDLEDIVYYISKNLKEPTIARKIYTKIINEIKKLKTMPHRHAYVSDIYLHSLGIRPFYIDHYITPYIIIEEKKTVLILRVLYARRDWKNLL